MEPGIYFDPRISPDGSRLALTVVDADNWDVWIYDLGGQTASRLTFDPAVDQRLAWTLDGRRVVFASNRGEGASNLFWKAADGTGQVERLTTSPNAQAPGEVLPDGRTMFFAEVRQETLIDIGLLSLDGDNAVEWLFEGEANETHVDLSPDGRWLVYLSDESGKSASAIS